MTEEKSPAPRAPKANAEPAPTLELKTPEQWAEQLGELVRADPRLPQTTTHYRWRHAAANAAYGWALHAYHYADKPFLISEQVYSAALDAAVNHPPQELLAAAFPPSHPRANQENS